MKNRVLTIGLPMLLAAGGPALLAHPQETSANPSSAQELAKNTRLTHRVTPKNIAEQAFAFSVRVKDVRGKDAGRKEVNEFKEFEIVVKQKAGGRAPVGTADGTVVVNARGEGQPSLPDITRLTSRGVLTYTFRLAPAEVERARFTFMETSRDALTAFPTPGDCWEFDLRDFVDRAK